MGRTGIVIETFEDVARVAARRGGPCGECADDACAVILPRGGGAPEQPEIIEVHNRAGARPGDTVEIDLPGHAELRVSLLVWGLPVLGLIAGGAVGTAGFSALAYNADAGALIGSVVGFMTTFRLLRGVDSRAAQDPDLRPYVVRVLPAAACHQAPAAPCRPPCNDTP